MIFSVILLLLLLGIAYFHYAQGFFGATISAVIAVFAAILAVGYHENVVVSLLGGKMADYAHAMTLCAIFAGVYITGRVITDSAIPGNMRLPVMVDRIGGALMGLVAGVFTTGVLALAAQALPFGPSIAGYTRLELEDDREVQVTPFDARGDRAIDVAITDQVKENGFTEASRQSLWIPVDDLLLATVQKLSDNGSMAGARTLYSVHPNYADELFGQRLGIQLGAQRTALNVGGKTQVRLADPGLFVVPQDLTKNQVDAELDTMHTTAVNWKKKGNEAQLIVRVMFAAEAADKKDSTVRVSPD